jgi:hypothetical protein
MRQLGRKLQDNKEVMAVFAGGVTVVATLTYFMYVAVS